MLDRFTPDVAKVLKRSRAEARAFGHDEIGLHHLLLAFASDPNANPSRILQARGLSYPVLCRLIERVYGKGPITDSEPATKPEINRFLENVIKIAKWPKNSRIPAKIVFDALADDASIVGSIVGSRRLSNILVPNGISYSYGVEPIVSAQLFNSEIPMACGDFNEAANFALLFARVEAATFNCLDRRIDSESLLVGLIAEQSGTAGKLLRQMGLTIRRIRGEEFEADAHKVDPREFETLVFSSVARRLLHRARTASLIHNQRYVTSLHLLWAILSYGTSAARDLLASLVDDLAALKFYLEENFTAEDRAATPKEAELNFRIFDAFVAGQELGKSAALDKREILYPGLESADFDLSLLNQDSIDVLLFAFREYKKLTFVNFDVKHVFLGLLAHRRSLAAETLAVCGVTIESARLRVGEMESLGVLRQPGKKLPDDVAALMQQAMLLSQYCECEKVSPNHIFWAMVKSVDLQLMILLNRLNLDPVLLCDHASWICRGTLRIPKRIYSGSDVTPPTQLSIFDMLCESGVAIAAEVALDQARCNNVKEVGGDFLCLGLLCAPGLAATVLQAIGLRIDTVCSAISSLSQTFEPSSVEAADQAVDEELNLLKNQMSSRYARQLRSLQTILRPQIGPRALRQSILSPQKFLPFIRHVEELTIDEHIAPIIVYWSSQPVSRLLPPGSSYGTLVRESTFVGYFSDERTDPPDEWCFLVESPKLCLVLYGHQTISATLSSNYQCTGSMDPTVVSEAFRDLLPHWQALNLKHSTRIEDYRLSLGPSGSLPGYVQVLKVAWPEVGAVEHKRDVVLPGDGVGKTRFDLGVETAFNNAREAALSQGKALVATEHILQGLIESENPQFLMLLNRINVSPQAILEKLGELLS